MKRWFSDGAFRSILRNAAYLGSGSVASALLGLLALSCAGKGMSPEMFGVLVVIQAYTKAVSDFIKFQTWQFVVQFGTPALEHQNTGRFRDVVAFSFGLDIASGVIAVLGGMIMLPFLSHALGLDSESFWLAMLYCTLIPSMTSSTPTGVLRAFNRFDLIAIQQAIKPFLQAVGSVISYYFDLGFPGFIVTWYASNLIGGTLFWWFTARELRRRDIHGALRPRLFNVARRIEGAWNFVWTTNIAHTIWAARNSCTTVLVGVVLAGRRRAVQDRHDLLRCDGHPGQAAGEKLLSRDHAPGSAHQDPVATGPALLAVGRRHRPGRRGVDAAGGQTAHFRGIRAAIPGSL